MIVWLDHDDHTGATYAVYTDNARIWISDKHGDHTAATLVDTARGHQLGITPNTLIPMQSARRGIIMINPELAYGTTVHTRGTWEPAISFRDPRGFIERAKTLFGGQKTPTTPDPHPQFRDFDAPTIPLETIGSPKPLQADMTGIAITLVRNAQREQRSGWTDPEHLIRHRAET